jgi:hypothetical protein
MSIDVKFSIGFVLGALLVVLWYESKKRKMG